MLVTRGGVQPGDHVANVVISKPKTATTVPLVVNTTNVPESARLCRLVVPCGDRAIEQRGTPGYDIVVNIPDTCAPADAHGKRIVYVLATATDERAEPIAYARIDRLALPALGARITLNQWRTDFVNVPVDVTGIAPDLYRYRIDLAAYAGEAPVARARLDGGPTTSVSSTVRLPIDSGTVLDFDAAYLTSEITIEAVQPTGTPFSLGATDFPPRITDSSLDAATIRFRAERPVDPSARIDAVVVDGVGGSWLIENMRGPDVPLPQLPPAYELAADSELRLESVGATVRAERATGVVTSTTASPHVPSLRELPLGSLY
jgi:hypothetical protein